MERSPLAQSLLVQLRARGPSGAPELVQALGVSQPTFSRVVREEPAVLVAGRARATRYAARRVIPGVEDPLPVYEVTARGSRHLATLCPVRPRGFYVEPAGGLGGWHDDLPWFLNDLRPSGFLGRRVPLEVPQLGLPADVRYWSGDHVLAWLRHEGVDTVGNLVVGDTALVRALTAAPVNPVHGTAVEYAALAERALADGLPGSSAAGEQPKFLATRSGIPVLVKFSPPVADRAGARVADLLRAEHLALEAVAAAGFTAARSRVVEGDGRVFLEVERFDRTVGGGRSGVVSLLSLDSAFVGGLRDWTSSVVGLARSRRVPVSAVAATRWLDTFGALIANTDRHGGNLSFRFEAGVVGELAPVYDMLPMNYFPRAGSIVDLPFPLPEPAPSYAAVQRSALAAALGFWGSVAEEVGGSLGGIAAEAGERLSRFGELLERLPG